MKRYIIGATLTMLTGAGAQAQVTLSAEGPTPGSSILTTVMTLGELAASTGIANFQIQDGQTLTDSLLNVARGTTDVAPVPLVAPFMLSRGAGPYANVGAEQGTELVNDVRALFTFGFGAIGLYSYDSSAVDGWHALEGRRVLNGPPSGGALANARAMIQLIAGLEDGSGYTGIQANWGQVGNMFADGTGEAAVLPIYLPADERITQASAAGAITLYSVPRDAYESEAFQNYLASPGTAGFMVPLADIPTQSGLTISSDDEYWRSPMSTGAIVVNASMSDEMAGALTRLMLDNVDTFKNRAPYMRYVNLGHVDLEFTGMCGNVPLTYHPAAVVAWEEAGYTVPDCAKP
ncbi:C4-dicarboxylate ABC transporter substrate-binding protein [Roseinatronobacter alkalisoli]|uniref:C4-dicarboxylate ABC transporter substrate-binding protein n=1 Tax=Roseinatronobacter alkalisoli TaxID=3028235 RepID=A0ABT5TAL4_9RHOB|nr:C4-dicarboxylate ABC transporter substrate-binding protein [Roseinatronobacter sp. HJB301]MDD7972160.1 C4-dicarboxylate ABC transporter substrate-binding protein [Roseinatronobacter sp. HJB301]